MTDHQKVLLEHVQTSEDRRNLQILEELPNKYLHISYEVFDPFRTAEWHKKEFFISPLGTIFKEDIQSMSFHVKSKVRQLKRHQRILYGKEGLK